MKPELKRFGLASALLVSSCLTGLAQNVWKGTWATAVEWTGQGDMPKESLSGRSCRQIIHVSMGGSELRLKLSNEFGNAPVEMKAVYIADTDTGHNWDVNSKTTRRLTFSGKKSLTLAAGQAVYSDLCRYRLKAGQRLTITIDYGSQTPEHATSHRGSRTTSYIVQQKQNTSYGEGEKADHWYNLAALEVKAEAQTPTVAVLGNSITDGRGSTTNLQNRWTDFLSDALNTGQQPYGVLNLGIGGNCVVQGGLSQPAMQRFDRDILQIGRASCRERV